MLDQTKTKPTLEPTNPTTRGKEEDTQRGNKYIAAIY